MFTRLVSYWRKRSVHRPLVVLGTALIVATPALAVKVGYEYDDAGRLRRVVYPDTKTKDYKLDPAGNRTEVKAVMPTGGALAIVVPSYSVAENVGVLQVNVSRTGATAGAVSVGYSIVAGSALSGSDYTATATGTLNWTAGESASKMISITIQNDATPEAAEEFSVYLYNVTGGAVLGATTQAKVTIQANDFPTISIANQSANESTGTLTMTVSLTPASTQTHQVNFAMANGTAFAEGTAPDYDYRASQGVLTFAPNQTSKTISVPLRRIDGYEGNETFTTTLTSPTNGAVLGTATAIGTIAEEDSPPVFSVKSVSFNENAGIVYVEVDKTPMTWTTIPHSVSFTTANGTAFAGVDYAAISGTLTFVPLETFKFVQVQLYDDYNYEGDEQFAITLNSPTNGATVGGSGTVTIVENEPVGLGAFSFLADTASVSETAGTVTLWIRRVGPPGMPAASIQCWPGSVTATFDVDFNGAQQTISWGAGDTSNKACVVPIVNDSTFEGDESFGASLIALSGSGATINAPGIMTITIVDDETPPVGAPGIPTWSSTYTPCIVPNSCPIVSDIVLTWNSGGGTVTRYEIERDTGFTQPLAVLDAGNNTSYYVTYESLQFFGLGGESAWFRVRACNGSVCSGYSSRIDMRTPNGF